MSSGGSNELDQIERDELLQRFVPIHVFSYSSVRRLKEQEIGLRRVAVIHVCSQCDYQTPTRQNLVRHNMTHTNNNLFSDNCLPLNLWNFLAFRALPIAISTASSPNILMPDTSLGMYKDM